MSFASRLKKQIFIQAQRVVPQHQLSRVVGKLAASEHPMIKNAVIQAFKAQYGIDMSIAEQSNALKFKSFNEFLIIGCSLAASLPTTRDNWCCGTTRCA